MRRAEKRHNSRQGLLTAASDLMTERGSIDISLSDVAERSGMNAALIRYYFGSKQGLLHELVISLVSAGLEQVEGLVEMDLPPVDKLKMHVKGIIRLYFRYPFINRLIHAMLQDPDQARDVAAKITVPLAALQRKILEEGMAKGAFRQVDPMLFYFLLAGACDQIFVARNTLKFGFGVEEIGDDLQRRYADEVLGIILAGVRAPEPATGIAAIETEVAEAG